MNILWSPESISDLKNLYQYSLIENPHSAHMIYNRVIEQVEILTHSPHIGRAGRVPGTRELIISDTKYIIPYRVVNGTLQILRIYYSSRKWPEKFQ